MKRSDALIKTLTTVILAAAAFHFSTRKAPVKVISEGITRDSTASNIKPTSIPSAMLAPPPTSSDVVRRKDAMRRLDFALAALKGVASATEARQILSELRGYLVTLPPEIASAV